MHFEIIGEIAVVETIASGTGIRDIKRLRKNYGKGQVAARSTVTRRSSAQPSPRRLRRVVGDDSCAFVASGRS
jgi:hypothetical protein